MYLFELRSNTLLYCAFPVLPGFGSPISVPNDSDFDHENVLRSVRPCDSLCVTFNCNVVPGLAHRVPVNRNRNGIEIERGGLPGKLWERPQRLSQYLAGRETRIWRLEPAGHHGGGKTPGEKQGAICSGVGGSTQ